MNNNKGFTIVELLIVIVVIGILAALVLNSFAGAQAKARDTKRIDDVAAIVKAIRLWSVDTGKRYADMNAGSGGAVVGWFDSSYGSYPSVKSILTQDKYLDEGVVDPINNKASAATSYAYMIAPCNGNNDLRIVLARLEHAPGQTVAEQLPGLSCDAGSFTSYTTSYGMNYAKAVDLD